MWSLIYSELSAYHCIRELFGEIDDDQLEQELLRLQKMTLVELRVEFTTVTGKPVEILHDYNGS